MRVVHVITKGDVGGAQSVVRELAFGMRDRLDVHVVAGEGGPMLGQLSEAGVSTHPLPLLLRKGTPRGDFDAFKALCYLLRNLNPDVVHLHSSKAGIIGRAVCARLDLPAVYTAHGWPFQGGAPRKQRVVSFGGEIVAGRQSAHIVCVTKADFARARRLRIAPERRLHLIPNGIADIAQALQASPGSAPGALRVVMVARLDPPKRPDLAVDAARLCSRAMSLTLVGGGGWETELRKRGCLAFGNKGSIRIIGHSNAPEDFLRDADVALLASEYEGLPMTVLEAMRAGLPVVCNSLDFAYELGVSEFGIICDLSSRSIANSLESIGSFSSLRELGLLSREKYVKHYMSARMVESYFELYSRLANDSASLLSGQTRRALLG